ncbi:hypothetical protein F2Q70_00004905 [Brassica cretica]|uniref:Uncharacterized protein n=1 Tax=Brassica cretica TaxID=69181 RepID=A0A8S9IXJ4_BRACR|nr:hypothetical protein F2Q70_00004905 [Brassica cretica]
MVECYVVARQVPELFLLISDLCFQSSPSLKMVLTRMQKLQDLAPTMLELWNLMDTPIEEQQEYQQITCNIAASEHEITQANSLSEDFIQYVEPEVVRLDEVEKILDQS